MTKKTDIYNTEYSRLAIYINRGNDFKEYFESKINNYSLKSFLNKVRTLELLLEDSLKNNWIDEKLFEEINIMISNRRNNNTPTLLFEDQKLTPVFQRFKILISTIPKTASNRGKLIPYFIIPFLFIEIKKLNNLELKDISIKKDSDIGNYVLSVITEDESCIAILNEHGKIMHSALVLLKKLFNKEDKIFLLSNDLTYNRQKLSKQIYTVFKQAELTKAQSSITSTNIISVIKKNIESSSFFIKVL